MILFAAVPAHAQTITVKSITADAVYGQTGSFTSSTSNNGGLSATSLYQPDSVAVDSSGNVYVADLQNSRVLFYPAGSTTATRVYGQSNFTTGTQNTDGISADSLSNPVGITLDSSGNLYVADWNNNRVLFYLAGSTTATRVYGQATYGTNGANNGGVSATTLNGPQAVALDSSGNLYVADTFNNRVLFYPSDSTTATQVYGQASLTSNGSGVSATSLNNPYGVALDSSGGLYVADYNNNRVLFYPSGNTTASQVYGQLGSFSTGTANNGGVSAASLNGPFGVGLDGSGNLYVADYNNNRVLFYPSGSTTATNVYGQDGSFTTNSAHTNAHALSNPAAMALDSSGNLYVADKISNRVVQYGSFGNINVCPVGNNTPAPCNYTVTLNYYFPSTTTLGAVQVVTQGAANLDFTLASSGTCTGTVSAGSNCTVNVEFAPLAPGFRTGAVQLFDNTNSLLTDTLVQGIGQGPAVAFSPSPQAALAFTGLGYPQSIAVDAAGDVYITDLDNGNLLELPGGAGPQVTVLSGLSDPYGVAVDGAGDVYVTELFNGNVHEIPSGGGSPSVITSFGSSGAAGLALDAAGDLFVVLPYANQVVEIPANGSPQITLPTSGLNTPNAVAVDAGGDVFIANGNDQQVVKLPGGTGPQTTVGTGLQNPQGVAVDAAGNVFIADYNLNAIVEVPAGGGAQFNLPSSVSYSGQEGIAVDGAGDVFFTTGENGPYVVELQRSLPPSFNFASTNVGQTSSDSPRSVVPQNIGNQTLTATAPGLTGLAGGTNFAQVPGSGTPPDCTSTFSLTAGATCYLGMEFTPQSGGPLSGAAIFTDNALNGSPSTQSVGLSGTGVATALPSFIGATPANPSYLTTSLIQFNDADSNATFMCSFVVYPASPTWGSCTTSGPGNGSYTYSGSENTTYTFSVEAIDAGNGGTSSPASITWEIVPSQVAVSFAGSGTGTVTSIPSGLNCPGTCTAQFDGVPVTLTATPTGGSTFAGWTDTSGTDPNDQCPSPANPNQCVLATGDSYKSATATFTPPAPTNTTLTMNMLGTGNGNVFSESEAHLLNCSESEGVSSGICSGEYTSTQFTDLVESPGANSNFAGWTGCDTIETTNTTGDTCVTAMSTDRTVGANFTPGPITVTVNFPMSPTPVTEPAVFNCPGNPGAGGQGNPCTTAEGPNATSVDLTAQAVTTSFQVNVTATEVPPGDAPTNTDGICESNTDNTSASVTGDFDCRFLQFFNYGTDPTTHGAIVPLCVPYSNGNCVHYEVSAVGGGEPDPNNYVGPIVWELTWNNESVAPPANSYWAGSTPQVYDDPDYPVISGAPYGTDCINNPMTNGTGYFCQFEYNITIPGSYMPSQPVDSGIGGTTRQFNDVVVAWPPTSIPNNTTLPLLNASSTPDNSNVSGSSSNGIGFVVNLINTGATSISGITLTDPLPSGTGMNWSLASAPSGFNCAVNGSNPSQTLTCNALTVAPGSGNALLFHLTSPTPAAGQYTNVATFSFGSAQSPPVQQTFGVAVITVSAAAQSINVTMAPPTSAVYNTPFTVVASATSFLPVTYGSSGACSNSGGSYTMTSGTGTCNVLLSQSGNSDYSAAPPLSIPVTAEPASQTITFAQPTTPEPYNQTFVVSASSTSGLGVTITASGGCNINGGSSVTTSGTVKMTSGTTNCTLTASQAGNTNYSLATSVPRTVTAELATQTIILSNVPASEPENTPFTVSATGGASGNAVVFSATGDCTNSGTTGKYTTGTSTGTCNVIANQAGITNEYSAATQVTQGVPVTAPTGGVLKFSPSTFNFGTVNSGNTALAAVTVTNTGAKMVTFSSFKVAPIAGDDSTGFFGAELCPNTLNPGKTCLIVMSFTADTNVTATHGANLVITDNGAGSPQTVPLVVAGVINPLVSLSPTSVSFGPVKTGTTSGSKFVTVTNTGTTKLILTSITYSSGFAAGTGGSCTNTSSLAAKGGSCTIAVVFKPTSRGSRSGSITITDNAKNSPQSVGLSGTGN
jgi:sugar lactone lactonase YvrE